MVMDPRTSRKCNNKYNSTKFHKDTTAARSKVTISDQMSLIKWIEIDNQSKNKDKTL